MTLKISFGITIEIPFCTSSIKNAYEDVFAPGFESLATLANFGRSALALVQISKISGLLVIGCLSN